MNTDHVSWCSPSRYCQSTFGMVIVRLRSFLGRPVREACSNSTNSFKPPGSKQYSRQWSPLLFRACSNQSLSSLRLSQTWSHKAVTVWSWCRNGDSTHSKGRSPCQHDRPEATELLLYACNMQDLAQMSAACHRRTLSAC